VNDNELLAIDLLFGKLIKFHSFKDSLRINLQEKSKISFKDYNKMFKEVYKNLLDGNTYQVNLTTRFTFRVNSNNPLDYISRLWKLESTRGRHAHAIYSKVLGKLFLSNSPECLFHYSFKSKFLYSIPIKGTQKIYTSAKKAWQILRTSKKDQAELYMITDLMRNDLTKIQGIPSRLISLKKKLFVPGLVHSYSLIGVPVTSDLSLDRALNCLFPGGSITGAPKQSTIKIIKEVEKEERGVYCGSTVVMHKSLCSASINIRTACICFETMELTYGSGGAITLLSKANDEYKESLLKLSSFTQNFQG
jgi:anthranilate/para-aminobenzoate synthase component I